jgi:predicted DNA-binding antitoxin AbrB/MazE fold protein
MPSLEPVEAEPIEVIYEKGVLRPVRPLDLAEGTRLEVTVTSMTEIATPATPSTEQDQIGVPAEVDEATYAAFLSELDNIAALPPQSAPQPHAARNHDAILYPKQGTMP